MSEVKYTAGPWLHAHREQADGMYSTQVFTPDGETVATVAWYPKENGDGATSTYREANARLISAAPDLLEALEDVIDGLAWSSNGSPCPNSVNRGRAAVAKALGRK